MCKLKSKNIESLQLYASPGRNLLPVLFKQEYRQDTVDSEMAKITTQALGDKD